MDIKAQVNFSNFSWHIRRGRPMIHIYLYCHSLTQVYKEYLRGRNPLERRPARDPYPNWNQHSKRESWIPLEETNKRLHRANYQYLPEPEFVDDPLRGESDSDVDQFRSIIDNVKLKYHMHYLCVCPVLANASSRNECICG